MRVPDLEWRSRTAGLRLGYDQRPGDDDHHGGPGHELRGLHGHLHQLSRPGQEPLLGRVRRGGVQEVLRAVQGDDSRDLLHLL